MSKPFKRLVKTNSIEVITCIVLTVSFLAVLLSPTAQYKNAIHSLWNGGHHAAAYYLNYQDPALATEEGYYYFGNGAYDLSKATKAFELALALQPGTLESHYQLARIYFVQGDFAKATSEIDAELADNPTNLRSLYVRGLIEISQYNFSGAEEDFTNFVAWAPSEWGGYNDLAFVQSKEGEYAKAEATIQQALLKVPNAKDIPWLWNSLGLAQLNELHYTQAQASFSKALVLAKTLTPEEWHRAYSGNDPATIATDLVTFQNAIQSNLSTAQRGSTL